MKDICWWNVPKIWIMFMNLSRFFELEICLVSRKTTNKKKYSLGVLLPRVLPLCWIPLTWQWIVSCVPLVLFVWLYMQQPHFVLSWRGLPIDEWRCLGGGGGELSSICLIMGGVVPHLSHHGGESCPPSVSSWGELSSICLIMGVVLHLSHHGGSCPPSVTSWGGGELSSICLIMGGVVPHLSHHGGESCPPSVSSWGELSSICLIMGVVLHLSHHGGGGGGGRGELSSEQGYLASFHTVRLYITYLMIELMCNVPGACTTPQAHFPMKWCYEYHQICQDLVGFSCFLLVNSFTFLG